MPVSGEKKDGMKWHDSKNTYSLTLIEIVVWRDSTRTGAILWAMPFERKYGRTDGGKEERTDGRRKDGRTDGRADGRTGGREGGRKDERNEGRK